MNTYERVTIVSATTLGLLGGSALIGWALEGHTNDVARGKIRTVEFCVGDTTQSTPITSDQQNCLHETPLGGSHIGKNKISGSGWTADGLSEYVAAQEHEASSIEPYRVAGWAIGLSALTVGSIAISYGFGGLILRNREEATSEHTGAPAMETIE